jgi:hypothetical protein
MSPEMVDLASGSSGVDDDGAPVVSSDEEVDDEGLHDKG